LVEWTDRRVQGMVQQLPFPPRNQCHTETIISVKLETLHYTNSNSHFFVSLFFIQLHSGSYKEKCKALRLILYKYLIAKLTGGGYE